MESRRAWLALSLGAEREYAGNVGYADELDRVYRYDSFVPNHRQVATGDLLILCDREKALRVAEISRIVSFDQPKELRRCPECNVATIKVRTNKRPPYRCKAGHTFETPKVTSEPCTHFEARFEGACLPVPGSIPVQQVRKACPRFNGQLAIQELDLERLEGKAALLRTLSASLQSSHHEPLLFAHDAAEDAYIPNELDERTVIERQIHARRGQDTFRKTLLLQFGDTCLVTQCRLPELLEAAHISPYRGEKDHHPSNGLLLRADIHTLFDLNLLGIDPATLQVHLHPALHGQGYDAYAGHVLVCKPGLLSGEALQSRWKIFQAALRAHSRGPLEQAGPHLSNK
jgi:putative restriction endonuclease